MDSTATADTNEKFGSEMLVKSTSSTSSTPPAVSSNIVKHVRKINLLDQPNAFKEAV